jgi:hypothetical protein
MPKQQRIQLDEKVSLKLTAAERKLILEDLMCLDRDYEQVIRDTPPGQPVMMTLDDLDDFGGYIAAEANHCDEKRKQQRLDAIFEKIQALLDKYANETPL